MGDTIKSGKCRLCTGQGLGVQMVDTRGQPAVFHCKQCEPVYFHRLSMLDKERFLKGAGVE